MGDEGDKIKRRRERLGLTQTELGEAANPKHPIHRNTIGAMEEGKSGTRAKFAAVTRALDELEAEAGIDTPPAGAVEEASETGARSVVIKLGNSAVIVEGPADDLPALEASAMRLLRAVQNSEIEGV